MCNRLIIIGIFLFLLPILSAAGPNEAASTKDTKAAPNTAEALPPPTPTCASINTCQVVKSIYDNKMGWTEEYNKKIDLKNLCLNQTDPSHTTGLESKLGILVEVVPGDNNSDMTYKKSPWVQLRVYTYKTEFFVASLGGPPDASSLSLVYRIKPDKPPLLKIDCFKK